MKVILMILLLALLGLQYKLWFGTGSVRDWFTLHNKNTLQLEQNELLRTRNVNLLSELEELTHGDQTLEEQARQTLGMIRDDEVYFQFVEPAQSTH